jgi:hypothetical protein
VSPASRFGAVAAGLIAALAALAAGVVLLGRPAPLRVVEARPAEGETVPARSRVVVTFSRPIDEAWAETALLVSPEVDGFVSAGGRRLAFTPRAGFRPDTEYTVTIGAQVRDRGGRTLAAPVTIRFRTRGASLVVRAAGGRLTRLPVAADGALGAPEVVVPAGAGAFDVGPGGEIAYVAPGGDALVVQPPGQRVPADPARRIPLPRGVAVRQVAVSPTGRAVLFLGAEGSGVGRPYLARLEGGESPVSPFGPDPAPLGEAQIVEKLKKSLVEIVYGRETFAFAPDGRSAVLRDRTFDFTLFALDGTRRTAIGPYLAVGNLASNLVALVDVDPSDGLLRRRVLTLGRGGAAQTLSDPARDSAEPRIAHKGDRVVFTSAGPEGPPVARPSRLEVVTLVDGVRRPLTQPPGGWRDAEPHWSPDDAWIAFRREPLGEPERGQVWLVPAGGGEARPLPLPAAEARWGP